MLLLIGEILEYLGGIETGPGYQSGAWYTSILEYLGGIETMS